MITTAIVYHNASESTRQQHMKVLPVSFAMLLLATLVQSLIPHIGTILYLVVFLLVYCRRLDPSTIWIGLSNGRE